MSYSDFTPGDLHDRLGLVLERNIDLFHDVAEQPAGVLLKEQLSSRAPRALIINTEKIRSELIIAPILMEAVETAPLPLSIFSGTPFNVDPAQGLIGVCDFLLSQSADQFMIRAPVMVIVEAKNENMVAGIGQCGATMYAARLFNERAGNGPTVIYGAVTTGNLWRFLRLDGPTLFVDQAEYHGIHEVDKVLGILRYTVTGGAMALAR